MLTYMFALMGIHSSPAFSMWAFSNKDPEPFAPQQVWASSVGIGFALFFFTAAQGMGAHILGADPVVNAAGANISNVLPLILKVSSGWAGLPGLSVTRYSYSSLLRGIGIPKCHYLQ